MTSREDYLMDAIAAMGAVLSHLVDALDRKHVLSKRDFKVHLEGEYALLSEEERREASGLILRGWIDKLKLELAPRKKKISTVHKQSPTWLHGVIDGGRYKPNSVTDEGV